MNQDTLIKRIQALFSKGNDSGASRNEALSAIQAAHRLMSKHGITEDDVKKSVKPDIGFARAYNPFTKLNFVDEWCGVAIAKFTDTQSVVTTHEGCATLVFFGYRLDVEYAMIIRERLIESAAHEWLKHCAEAGITPKMQPEKIESFMIGFCSEVVEALTRFKQEAHVESTALVPLKNQLIVSVIKEIDPEFEDTSTEVSVYSDDYETSLAGLKAGKDANFLTGFAKKNDKLLS